MTNQAAIAKANQAVATQNIQAAHPPMTEEEKLTARWRTAKKAVQAAQDHLLAIEVEIWNHEKHRLPPKGTTTLDTGLKIVTGFTEKWDQESLNKAYQGWEAPYPSRSRANGSQTVRRSAIYSRICRSITGRCRMC